MTPSNELVEHCLELLRPLGAPRSGRMFGGRGFYVDDLFIAILIDETFYLKVDNVTQPAFDGAGGRPFTYTRRAREARINYWTVPAEAMESPALMQPWARLAIDAAVRARAVKPRAARKAAPATAPKPKATASRGKPATRRK